MNARLKLPAQAHDIPVSQDAVWLSVRQLLASPTFIKAPRMCRLLSYLVEKKLGGLEHQISEYAIGLEVFRRDAHLYDTGLDPVVRVQMGRLRGRLAAYYACLATSPGVRISIPLGKYIPVLTPCEPASRPPPQQQLQLAPLRNLTCENGGNAFVSGLEEELGYKLYQTFGAAVRLVEASPVSAGAARLGLAHRLEGSIRVEHSHVRVSMRLVDADAGQIAWLSQFDREGELGMHLQEELASAICGQLQHYMVGWSGGILPSWGSIASSAPVMVLR